MRNGMKTKLKFGVAAAAVTTLALTGCSTAGGGADEGKGTIGVSVADQKSLFYVAAVDGMKTAAEEAGYELEVLSADNDPSRQVSQIEDLITRQIDVLIFTSQDDTAAQAGVARANAADIPVIAVDQKPEGGDGELATYIATDSVKAAYDLCTWMFGQIDNEGKIAILQGPLGSTAEVQRTEGCNNALDENEGIEVVAWEDAGWDETQAFEASQNILTAHPDLEAIFGESDAMAMGAAKAAEQGGYEDLLFAGIDGFPTMFDSIESGLTQATMAQRPYEMGQLAVQNAIQILEGEGDGIPEEQYQDAVLVTRENITEFSVEDFYGPNVN